MSDMQDKLRRLAKLRSPRSRRTTLHNGVDFDAEDFDGADFDTQEDQVAVAAEKPEIHAPSVAYTSDFETEVARPTGPLPLHRLIPGYEIVNAAGQCYCTVQAYPLDEPRGPSPLRNLLDVPPAIFHRYHPTFGLGDMADYRRAAFLDTETTGLGGGAGVYCFMVGVGTFEAYQPYAPDQLPSLPEPSTAPTHFVVRQFFMRNPAEEGALLVALADLLARYEMTVTFNGRSFDLPLLRMRYMHNRRFLPLDRDVELLQDDRPHLDLLMPARRVWRRRLQSCRLINLEQMILGIQRTEDDVPGALIPELYMNFVRTGYAEAMRRVFYHNYEDIVTMVALADHLSRAFGEVPSPTTPLPSPTITGMDWAGLGRVHERAGDLPQAISAYRRALESVRNPADRADIYRSLGEIYKKQGEWSQAAETWQEWMTSVPGSDPTPYVELAKYCEWQLRDLEQAEMWTAWALHNLQKAHPAARRPGEMRQLEQRLARLQRKRNRTSST